MPPLLAQIGKCYKLAWQVSFLGIRNRGNRNNGFYSWDYVDLGLNSAHATKNSGLRPLGLNSEIKTSIATFDEKKLILGIETRPAGVHGPLTSWRLFKRAVPLNFSSVGYRRAQHWHHCASMYIVGTALDASQAFPVIERRPLVRLV